MVDAEEWCLFEGEPAEIPDIGSAQKRRRINHLGYSPYDVRYALARVLGRLRTNLEAADALGAAIPPTAREIADELALSDRYRDEDHKWVEGLRRLPAGDRETNPGYAWLAREGCRRYIWRMTAEEKTTFWTAKAMSLRTT